MTRRAPVSPAALPPCTSGSGCPGLLPGNAKQSPSRSSGDAPLQTGLKREPGMHSLPAGRSHTPWEHCLADQERGDVHPCPLSPQLPLFWLVVTVTVPWCAQRGGDPDWERGTGEHRHGLGGRLTGAVLCRLCGCCCWAGADPGVAWVGGEEAACPVLAPGAEPGAVCPDSCRRVLSRLLPSFVIPRLPPLVYVRVPFLRLSEISFSLCGQETDFNCLYFLPPLPLFFF